MRVTSKGQVTIPLGVRQLLKIRAGSEVDFLAEGNTVRIVPARAADGRGKSLVKRLRGRATARMSTEQIMALTRGGR
jgi:AbrB family looped-hinge helix DNA binding protein